MAKGKKKQQHKKQKPGAKANATEDQANAEPATGMARLFVDEQYAHLLLQTLSTLSAGDLARAARVCRNANHAVASSSRLQLVLRRAFHCLPESFQAGEPNAALERIIEREKRLAAFKPREIQCLHILRAEVLGLEDGYLLTSEANRKKLKAAHRPDWGFQPDGWSIWKLPDPSAPDFNPDDTVAKKSQGVWRWKADVGVEGGRIENIVMCPQDNLVVVGRRSGPVRDPASGLRVYVNRLFFYLMRPLPDAGADDWSEKGLARPHPQAALPFIEVLTPFVDGETREMPFVQLHVIPGGRITCHFPVPPGQDPYFAGAWNWKTGKALGRFSPDWSCFSIFASRFLTPDWVLCSTFVSNEVDDDPGDWHFQQNDFGFCPCIEVYDLSNVQPVGPTRLPVTPLPAKHANEGLLCSWRIEDVPEAPLLGAFHLAPASKPNLPTVGGTINGAYTPQEFRLESPLASTPTGGTVSRASGVLSFVINGVFVPFSAHSEEEHVSLQGSVPVDHLIALLVTDQAVKAIPNLTAKERSSLRYRMRRLRDSKERLEALSHAHASSTKTLPKSEQDTALHIPWSELSAVVDIRTNPSGMGTASWGSRVLGINPCDGRCSYNLRLLLKIESLGLMEGVFTIYDYNPALFGREDHVDFPLGTTRSLYNGGSSPRPIDLRTHVKDCPQPKAVPVPEFDHQRSRQAYKGSRVLRDPIQLAHKQTTCALPFMWQSTHLTFDQHETCRGLLFDGDRIVFGTKGGANIITF